MIVVNSNKELKELIRRRIEEQGPNCDLNDTDVSRVTDMYEMFAESDFNGDISQWNVSNVEDMYGMFYESEFNGDISLWDVSGTDTRDMFYDSPLEGREPSWYEMN